jgi:hypothetical protein
MSLLPPDALRQAPGAEPLEALDVPPSTPVLALGHCFYLPTLGRASILMHLPAHISGGATLTPRALVLHFQALPDELCFEFDRAQLAASPPWIARYPLRGPGQPRAPVGVWYHYAREDATGLRVSTLRFSSASCKLRGYVAITAYDAQHQLLSGHFEIRANDQPDPTAAPAGARAGCTIILAGDFDHVKLKIN